MRHACDNRACINPEHLSWGTGSDNALDRVRAGTNSGQKLDALSVLHIRTLSKMGWPFKQIARFFRIDAAHAARIVQRRSWGHV